MAAEPARSYEEEAAALYAVPPARFTAARDTRVAELRGAHQAVLAGRLKLLRRPTVAAWCVNLLAAAHAVELRALVELGAELAAAQRRADPVAIRGLSAQRRARVADLVAAAGRAAGTTLDATVVADLEATLNAAVADASVANRVLSGQLVRGESFAGFGPLPGAPPSEGPRRGRHDATDARATSARATADAAAARCKRDDVRRVRDVARHAHQEAAAVLAEAERRLVDAERDLAAADRALDRAERDRRQAAERLDVIEQALSPEGS